MALDRDLVVGQLERLMEEYLTLKSTAKYDDASDLGELVLNRMATRMQAAIDRVAPTGTYAEAAARVSDQYALAPFARLPLLAGVITALRDDVAAGWMTSVEELLHADTFADFTAMASELLTKGYKDAAAVIAGSVLEAHIRMLCAKHQIDTVLQGGKPKKADSMNAELVKATVYSGLEQKQVTAWLGTRNEAAHGNYGAYTADEVALLIAGVEGFITRHPA